jgi:hypothetical protein
MVGDIAAMLRDPKRRKKNAESQKWSGVNCTRSEASTRDTKGESDV